MKDMKGMKDSIPGAALMQSFFAVLKRDGAPSTILTTLYQIEVNCVKFFEKFFGISKWTEWGETDCAVHDSTKLLISVNVINFEVVKM